MCNILSKKRHLIILPFDCRFIMSRMAFIFILAHVQDKRWTGWGAWSKCAVSCDQGQQSRKRQCIYTSPSNSPGCNGMSKMLRLCSRGSCKGNDTDL